jgi:hypothetical protein
LNASTKRENELENKINDFIEQKRDYEEKIRSSIKELENLKLELKKVNDIHKNYVEKIEYFDYFLIIYYFKNIINEIIFIQE